MKARRRGYGIDEYTQQVTSLDLPVLTRQEELELIVRAKRGEDDAGHLLVLHNLPFVIYIAKRFLRIIHSGLELADMVQEGNVGLIEAIPAYRVELGARFPSYARYHVAKSILNRIRRAYVVYVPLHIYVAMSRWHRAEESIVTATGRFPTPGMVADVLKLTPTALSDLRAGQRAVGMPQWDDLFDDIITRPHDVDFTEVVDAELDRQVDADRLYTVLETLDIREAVIIILRFGLGGAPRLTLSQIGMQLGVSWERVRQLQAIGIVNLAVGILDRTG
jgi:RNA polymerase primary sigma factor